MHHHYTQAVLDVNDRTGDVQISAACDYETAYAAIQDIVDRGAEARPDIPNVVAAAELWRNHGADDDYMFLTYEAARSQIVWHVYSCDGDCIARNAAWLDELDEITYRTLTLRVVPDETRVAEWLTAAQTSEWLGNAR